MFTIIKLFIALSFISNIAYADNLPTVHQIYQTANSGKLDEAHQMVEQVLQVHPESAKAHFVDAEILAKQGALPNAKTELETAERLAPGLPFAKPEAVQNLKQRIAISQRSGMTSNIATNPAPTNTQTFPWMLLFIGFAAIVLITWLVKSMISRRNDTYTGNVGNNGMPGQGYPMPNGGPNNWSGSPAATYPPQAGSGIGGGIVSGLATGAAVGAGIVAGEALMHHFTDGTNNNESVNNAPLTQTTPEPQYDMGGSDFGLADSSSWDDDTSSSGGDGW
ncbi:tetratricopeptide repeat protein [Sulfuriferula nivalis]|uniref:Tetratricopeptide repeat protein n=1 Tax=Sulfuriferula nivalis TaxID=2675298 RepID=A0A809S899_9PROT|nr:tetratricopeptide repeat protein [Sulfuriferula nivalis]BBP00082.1 hypothetical protein SFSGTM_07900 [Sulfuriferula nivalis]